MIGSFGIMFHHFHGGKHPEVQGSISAFQLEGMLDKVSKEYTLLPALEWYKRVLQKKLGPKDVCLTFDDNLRCQFDVAFPVLQKRKLTGFWFVYTNTFEGTLENLELYRHFRTTHFGNLESFYEAFFKAVEIFPFSAKVGEKIKEFDPKTFLVDFPFYSDVDRKFRYYRDKILDGEEYIRVMESMIEEYHFNREAAAKGLWMDVSCLQQLLREGHIIGLHSHTHPLRMKRLSTEDQSTNYTKNFEMLRSLLEMTPVTMSHPCNSYNQDTLKILKDLGIQVGFRANMKNMQQRNNLEYAREDHANLIKKYQL